MIDNAGIMLLGFFFSDQHGDYAPMIQTSFLGAITATEVFLDQLRDGGGDLINISSVAGRTARPGAAVYAATKWGINGFSEALRQELRPEVRVTVIEPAKVARRFSPLAGQWRAAKRELGNVPWMSENESVSASAVQVPRSRISAATCRASE